MPIRNKTRILIAKDVVQTINAEKVQLTTSCVQTTTKKCHFAKMCHSKKKCVTKQTNRLNALEESSNFEVGVYISAITTGDKKN